jgi:biofilm protein TabA
MILDMLSNCPRYYAFNNGLKKGFDFLARADVADLEDGRYEIEGDRVYAIIQRTTGRSQQDGQLEAHRRYTDIQFIINGDESMGWSPLQEVKDSSLGYDEKNDLEFFAGTPSSVVRVAPGSFAIFTPSDAHLPCIGEGAIHKVVVKVLAE